MKKKYYFVILFLILVMFLSGCGGVITPTNQAPIITSTPITTATVDVLYTYDVDATDPDGDTLTYFLVAPPAGMIINFLTGLIAWTPTTSGNYNVTVEVSDGDLSDTQSFIITVTETPNQSPTASFTADPTSGIAPLEVSFNASSSSDSDGTIVSYAWDFKDGNTGSGETLNHTFISIGSYSVELTVTDNEGATDSTTKTITVTYECKVEYKIWGSATSVFITLSNSTGGTEQYSDVLLPKVYSYSNFSDNFLYISAQNNGSSGTVNVECYYEGVLKDSAHSEGAYVIATASYYISDYW